VAILVYAPDRAVVREDGVVELVRKDGGREAGWTKGERHAAQNKGPPHYRLKSEINIKLSKAKVPTNKRIHSMA
jgi:hypothetical protein